MASQPKQPPCGSPAWFVDMVAASQNKPTMHIVDLTPTLAEFMLKTNDENRRIRSTKLGHYVSDIKAGKWVLNGEPIIIAKNGAMNDGQHRCAAVVESGLSIPVVMMFGLSRDSRDTLDQGAMRSASDVLQMRGSPNSTLTASIARFVISYERSFGKNMGAPSRVTTSDVVDRVSSDPMIGASGSFANMLYYHCRGLFGAQVAGFCHYILARVDPNMARHYLESVGRGENLSSGDPAFEVRNKIQRLVKPTKTEHISIILHGWRHYRSGRRCHATGLKTSGDLPEIA